VSRRRGRGRERTWWPPAAPPAPAREVLAGAPAQRPSWARAARVSLGQSAATAARLGQGLPPAIVGDDLAGGELVDLDPTGPPVCPACGSRHETPGELRPSPMARPLFAGPRDAAALTRDGFRPPGWGRARGRCS
jgi:hypothetical protein